MTLTEIDDGNILIAEFMQYDKTDDGRFKLPFTLIPYSGGVSQYTPVYQFKFHSSWDWLMPVLQKIWELGAWEYTIVENGCSIFGEHEQPPYINGQGVTTIETVWSSVTQFIQWYNTKPP